MTQLVSEIEVDCPCCGSVLVVDFNLRRVVSHQEPERDDKPILEDAHQILDAEAARREAAFRQSVTEEKGRSDALSKRFEEALERAKDEPVAKPVRDFDLD
jgi:hypothetical protein